MRKHFEGNKLRGSIAAVSLAVSLAAFGCTTNRNPGNGVPVNTAPAVTTTPTSTPGSSSGTITIAPRTMVSSSTDAIATLAADQGYRGRVLGPASPGGNQPAAGIVTGQFVSPSAYANPQATVNSSISSAPVPAILSGAAGDGGVFVAPSGVDVTGGVITGPANSGAIVTPANVGLGTTVATVTPGATGLTNAFATPPTNGVAGVTGPNAALSNTPVGTGVITAPATSGNVVATPAFGTSPTLNVNNAAAATKVGGSTMGIQPRLLSGGATAPVSIGVTTGGTAGFTARGTVTPSARPLRTGAGTAGTGVVAGGIAPIRVIAGTNGSVIVTNVQNEPKIGRVRAVRSQ